jgi:hypothetical protein
MIGKAGRFKLTFCSLVGEQVTWRRVGATQLPHSIEGALVLQSPHDEESSRATDAR